MKKEKVSAALNELINEAPDQWTLDRLKIIKEYISIITSQEE